MFTLLFLGDGKPAGCRLHGPGKDPNQISNVAGRPAYSAAHKQLRAQLDQWMKETADPRAVKDDDHWDSYPYFGE